MRHQHLVNPALPPSRPLALSPRHQRGGMGFQPHPRLPDLVRYHRLNQRGLPQSRDFLLPYLIAVPPQHLRPHDLSLPRKRGGMVRQQRLRHLVHSLPLRFEEAPLRIQSRLPVLSLLRLMRT